MNRNKKNKSIINIFKKDFWHEEMSIILLTIAFFLVLIWTFWKGDSEMYDYLNSFTNLYYFAVLAFGGLKTYKYKKGKDSKK